MPYTPLPIITVELDELQLDLDNYRIPTQRTDQAAALAYLFASEDVLGAARMIIRDGYFDNEVPIVTASGARYIVLEGNRRVSALKALHNPDLVPNHATEVRALLRRYELEAADLPTSIRVLVADSRDQAAPHIAQMHSGRSKRAWSRDQQANYYYSLLGPQTTVDDIKSSYPDVDVVRFIKMAAIRRFLAGVRFSDRTLRSYVAGDAPGLKMSSFEYAYRGHTDICAAIGADFDRDGQLLPRQKKPESIAADLPERERQAVEYLIGQFRANTLNTRASALKKDTPEHDRLLELLLGTSLTTSADGDGQPEADTEPSGGTAGEATKPGADGAGVADIEDQGDHDDAAPEGGSGRGPNDPDTKDKLQLGGASS